MPGSEEILAEPGYLNDACHVEAAVGCPSFGRSRSWWLLLRLPLGGKRLT